jgi:hypothetical protein
MVKIMSDSICMPQEMVKQGSRHKRVPEDIADHSGHNDMNLRRYCKGRKKWQDHLCRSEVCTAASTQGRHSHQEILILSVVVLQKLPFFEDIIEQMSVDP